MKANELMIGDWVLYNETPQQVLEISGIDNEVYLEKDELVYQSEIQPIPLTAEILEKNGFVCYEEDEESFHDKDCVFIKQKLGEYAACLDKTRTISGIFYYVHELQHALRLCKIEKELIL